MFPLDYLASFLCRDLREFQELVDNLDVCYHHSTTAISSNTEFVKYLDGPVSSSDSEAEGFPLVRDEFAAREASDWYDHISLPV
jgi:hypothetical protein